MSAAPSLMRCGRHGAIQRSDLRSGFLDRGRVAGAGKFHPALRSPYRGAWLVGPNANPQRAYPGPPLARRGRFYMFPRV
jgi:hypothetical protein